MRRSVIALLVCFKAYSATITSTQIGNWATPSTWVGGVAPGIGDRAVIAHKVTIPTSTSVTVGDSPAAFTNVVTINAGAELVNQGTLTLRGDLVVGPNAAIYTVAGGSTTQFESGTGIAYRLTWPQAFNSLPYPLIRSTATSWANPAIIQTKPGNVGNNGAILTFCCDSALNLQYTKLISLGDVSNPGVAVGASVVFNNVLSLSSGQLKLTANGGSGNTFCLDRYDVRLPTQFQTINVVGPATISGCNSITNSVILESAAFMSANLQATNLTVSNTIFGIDVVQFPVTAGHIWNNVLMATNFADEGGVAPAINSGWVWDGGGFWQNEGSGNPHAITDGQTAYGGTAIPNSISNLVINGNAHLSGDLWVSPGVHYVNRVINVNGAGNLDDGTGSPTAFGWLNHNTSENADGGGAQSTIALDEFSLGNQIKQVTNTLIDRNKEGACWSSSAAPSFTQQTGFTYDYNWFSNKVADNGYSQPGNQLRRPWNASTNSQGSVCNYGPFSKGTITVSTVSTANNLVVSSTTSPVVNVGDYLYHVSSAHGAFVLAVPSSGNVTIGKNEDGVNGLPSAIAGQSLIVLPSIWTSGVYGDAGKGQHEGYSDPRLANKDADAAHWDAALGGPGTIAHARSMLYYTNGWDESGNAVTPNPAYTVANFNAYVRRGLAPTSLALAGTNKTPAWTTATVYAQGDTVMDSNRHLQICRIGGTSNALTWNKNGGITSDGVMRWGDQGFLNVPGATPMTVYNAPGITGGGVY